MLTMAGPSKVGANKATGTVMEKETVGTIVTLIVLAALVVMNGGVFQRRNQNWQTIIALAIGMPVFIVVMMGIFGLVFG